ncbi:glycosyltransferase family 2 protein [Beggiatoa leptomitoformis]|uniref:Glycosyltransferase n=1 Tax=Beggiatoa leptomitoformis TaxID=288004 RepID=A0A2N9YDT1_9GAMM|nr:cellulose synthase catalytic subunit [Beggiatoa leptomitoformis]ALG68973.1 glycosyltransferase [Beggiatoa leptomitoformis]AUI68634.1 glycosyltransferase [Beggiatoa leptomitoformis]
MDTYFKKFEDRIPPSPLPFSPYRELLWQFLAVITIVIGVWYLHWRWTNSLNYDALWFSLPLVIAETMAYIGLILYTINLWQVRDTPQKSPPHSIRDCIDLTQDPHCPNRPIQVDVFIATYNEDTELVRLSIRDAKKITYPHTIILKVHVLDDGKRPAMQQVAKEEAVNYITRNNNIGFKAGNLANAMDVTSGDFFIICDADTRPFPTFLEHTLGYFTDPQVAWVQTPQWFFDIPEGQSLPLYLQTYIGKAGKWLGEQIEKIYGTVAIGYDPFVNDPKIFYDIILRRRNWANASFCCGAGSIYRREAVREAQLIGYADSVSQSLETHLTAIQKLTGEKNSLDPLIVKQLRYQLIHETHFDDKLFKFHVSEDIFTSIVLHSVRRTAPDGSEQRAKWKSVLHPIVESKMLSPQDLQSWVVQRFKYAGGTLDIAKDILFKNKLFTKRNGLSWAQRLMYGQTIWSYLGGIWNLIFLLAPIIYFLTAIKPMQAFSDSFVLHFLPFIISMELAFMVGTWGTNNWQSKTSYLAFYSFNIKALWTVLRGKKIAFPVTPKDRQTGNFLHLVWSQCLLIGLTLGSLAYAWFSHFAPHTAYSSGALILNSFWGILNIIALSSLVRAAFWTPPEEATI